MRVYVCTSPFQVFTSINMQYESSERGDIYLISFNNNLYKFIDSLIDTEIFENVFYINDDNFFPEGIKNKYKRHKKKFYNALNSKKIINNYTQIENTHYDSFFFASPSSSILLMIVYALKQNKGIKIHLFEDGMSGYSNSLLKSNRLKVFYNILGKGKAFNYDDILVYQPSLFSGETDIPIKKITSINSESDGLKSILNRVFLFENQAIIKEKFIFLDQALELLYPNLFVDLQKFVCNLANELNNDRFIIKYHPRSEKSGYGNIRSYEYSYIPWEVLCLNSDTESKVLITYSSTSGMTPKNIFDTEPYVIFLYKMKEFEKYNIPLDSYGVFDKFLETYRDKTRVFFPESINELIKVISTLDEKLK